MVNRVIRCYDVYIVNETRPTVVSLEIFLCGSSDFSLQTDKEADGQYETILTIVVLICCTGRLCYVCIGHEV